MDYQEAGRQLIASLAEVATADGQIVAQALELAGPVHTEALLASLSAYGQALRLAQASGEIEPPALTAAGARRLPMPEKNETVRVDFPLTAEQFESLKQAHVPQDGWDRWYVDFDEAADNLMYYRNASGYCFFIAHVEPADDGFVVGDVIVNRDDKQYTEESLKTCAAQLKVLLALDLGLDDEPYWDEMED